MSAAGVCVKVRGEGGTERMGALRIIGREMRQFRDRAEAGRLLAAALAQRGGMKGPLVLGILRGGILIAREIARELGGEIDLILARKLGAPYNPELAIGAVTEGGELFVNEHVAAYAGADEEYIAMEREREMMEIARRVKLFRSVYPRIPLKGRRVILTDDGVATGATMRASLWAARREKPARLVAALPVGPEDTVESLAREADELVCLRCPPSFSAVGQFYRRFDQVEDEEVLGVLRAEPGRRRR